MLKALIIDDNQHRNELIRLLMLNLPAIKIAGRPSSLSEGMSDVLQKRVDVIFLNTAINNKLIFKELSHYNLNETQLVFTSETAEYALEAHRYSPTFYLIKPYNKYQVELALKHILRKKFKKQWGSGLQYFPIKSIYTDILSLSGDILYCKQFGNTTFLALDNGTFVQRHLPLGLIDALLPDYLFPRINDKCIINISHLIKIKHRPFDNLLLDSGHCLHLAEERKPELMRHLEHIALNAS